MSKRLEDYFIIKNDRKLRYGYTTGSCATAAAKAACTMLLSKQPVQQVEITTPFGIVLQLDVLEITLAEDCVTCAIQKDAGDDPDVTNGVLVYATVRKSAGNNVTIEGGVGVGRVTRQGLEQAVGQAAINRTPRETMTTEIQSICHQYQYQEGIQVIITVPQGTEIAKRTFNPRLGIVDGISILGTSGIVVPMSEEALIKSIEVELCMRLKQGDKYLLVTPGNYGEQYLKDCVLLPFEKNIKCSNYVGKTIDMAIQHGAKGLLFVAHIGKFIKVAGGIMDTHSKSADCRAELMATSALRAGAPLALANQLLDTVTTDEGLAILKQQQLLTQTMQVMMDKIHQYLCHRAGQALQVGAIVFSNTQGYLGKTACVDELIAQIQEEN